MVDLISTIAGMIVGAILTLVFEQFIFEPFIAPSLRFKLKFSKKKLNKYISNPKIKTSFIAKASIETDLSLEDFKEKIKNELSTIGAATLLEGNDLKIEEFDYGRTKTSGLIRFSYKLSNELIVNGLEIILSSECRFRTFAEELMGLSKALEKVKDGIRSALSKPISFFDILSCPLNNIYELTGILDDLKLSYMRLGGEVEMDLGTKSVTFYRVIGPEVISKLRELVILYY